jgi:SAM-dependent methyltransferase
MAEIDLLNSLTKHNRPLNERAIASDEDRKFHWALGKEYFDGTRAQGLGGYHYDGRYKTVVHRMAAYYGLSAQSRVLDVGCAKGFLIHDFLLEIPGINVAGLDISSYAISQATELTKPFVYLGNAKELPFEDNSFDLAVSINSLHNILDRKETTEAIQEIERISAKHKYIKVGAYRNEEEKAILDKWAVVATTYLHVNDWLDLFADAGYTGDYSWFNP